MYFLKRGIKITPTKTNIVMIISYIRVKELSIYTLTTSTRIKIYVGK